MFPTRINIHLGRTKDLKRFGEWFNPGVEITIVDYSWEKILLGKLGIFFSRINLGFILNNNTMSLDVSSEKLVQG